MPSLTIADRMHMLGPVGDPCCTCGGPRVRHYCRSCDAFFVACWCAAPEEHEHLAHRVYLWTPDGVVARPNFDIDIPWPPSS